MDYDALIFDVDGTAVQSNGEAMPTPELIEVVSEARKYLKVACATGRSIKSVKHVISALKLTSPCIISGGAQIIDPISFEPIWEMLLSGEKVRLIVEKIQQYEYYAKGTNDPDLLLLKDYKSFQDHPSFYIVGVTLNDVHQMLALIKTVTGISAHYATSWEAGKLSIQITSAGVSKKRALEEWLKIEKTENGKVIAVGDSNNDLPLFEIASFKIAMGESNKELMSKADWIAPTIEEDGLMHAIRKYILQSE